MNIVAHNLSAMNTQRQLGSITKSKKKTTEKLASGYKINRAADDAAGLTISEKMRTQIRGLNQGANNIQDGISLCQIADGALSEVQDMLHRMTELSIKSANGTNTAEDRQAIQEEINQLSSEITRIGKSTEFNTMHIFDNIDGEQKSGSITQLVSCASADKGYLSEAISRNGYSWPAAYIDFSNVNARTIPRLNDGNFGFYCSRGCNEVFDITLKTDGTPSSCSNMSGKTKHNYVIDISNCKNGDEIVDAIYSYIGNHLPTGNTDSYPSPSYGDLPVSHSNNLAKVAGGKLAIYANTRVVSLGNYSTVGFSQSEAENYYPIPGYAHPNAGMIYCSNLLKVYEEDVHEFEIQCSGKPDDTETIRTHKMNAGLLGVEPLDVSSESSAKASIRTVNIANDTISGYRSEIGAYQNRLEHALYNNNNEAENTQAAETLIRDADMAAEMVELSRANIIEQVGQAMLSQANQSNQGVLSLLS